MITESYLIPEKTVTNEIIVVNSTFISTVGPVFNTEEAREFIRSIKIKYPDATHHVPAYVIGHGNSTIAYCSDDGEPSGTSGRPVLAVLQGSGLGDAAIVVTRYFGGTKLGIGGLVHAYSDAAKSILEILPRAKKVPTYTTLLAVPYPFFERTRLLLAKWKAEKLDEAFGIDVMITSRFLIDHFEGFQKDFSELTSGQIKAEIIETNPETIMPLGAFEE
ncbi:MAG: YigZ family protein [Flexilinea sp.]